MRQILAKGRQKGWSTLPWRGEPLQRTIADSRYHDHRIEKSRNYVLDQCEKLSVCLLIHLHSFRLFKTAKTYQELAKWEARCQAQCSHVIGSLLPLPQVQLPFSHPVYPQEHQACISPFFLMLLSETLKSDMLCVRAKACVNQQFQIQQQQFEKSKNGPWGHQYLHVHNKYLTMHLCNVQYSWGET